MSQQLTVRVARLDRSLTAVLDLITGLRAKLEALEERMEEIETAPPTEIVDGPCPTVVEIMPRKRGRPRRLADG